MASFFRTNVNRDNGRVFGTAVAIRRSPDDQLSENLVILGIQILSYVLNKTKLPVESVGFSRDWLGKAARACQKVLIIFRMDTRIRISLQFLDLQFLAPQFLGLRLFGLRLLGLRLLGLRFLGPIASVLLTCSLTGCSSINEKIASGMGDYVPQWAGGLPADAPPRPGTAKYDEYMKERERNRLLPADQRNSAKPDGTKTEPVH